MSLPGIACLSHLRRVVYLIPLQRVTAGISVLSYPGALLSLISIFLITRPTRYFSSDSCASKSVPPAKCPGLSEIRF